MIDDSSFATTKQCSRCEQIFPATPEFFPRRKKDSDKIRNWCKRCEAEHMREYRQTEKNRAYRKQYSIQYRQEHQEEIQARNKQYNDLHREERLTRQRQYRKDHPDLMYEQEKRKREKFKKEIRERKKRWQQSETYRAYQKRYQKEKIEEIRVKRHHYYTAHAVEWRARQRLYGKTARGRMVDKAHGHKRRAQQKAIDGTLTTQQIQAKLKAQKYTCYYCFTKFEKCNDKYIFHLEHTIPLARTEHSPRHDINYVVLSCPACNQKKGTRLPHEFWEGGRLF